MPLSLEAIRRRAKERVGKTVKGKFRLDELLGVGGMAAVYATTHRNGSRHALKILHERMDDDVQRDAFLREARLANKVGHPGALNVVDEDVDEDGTPFLVLPLLEGETLRARWERYDQRLAYREVSALTYALLDVLSAAHKNRIVHRDIKPENLFLTVDGQLRVLDFGIARQLEAAPGAITRTGRAPGTPAFMAPEQARGLTREVDGQTDLWAVGATMFTLISGQYVHDSAATADEFAIYSATRPAPKLASVAPGVPSALAAVVDRALLFDKSTRWTDALEMRAALEEAHFVAFDETIDAALVDLRGATERGTPKHADLLSQGTEVSTQQVDAIPSAPADRAPPQGLTRTSTGVALVASRLPLGSLRTLRLLIAGAGISLVLVIAAFGLRRYRQQHVATSNAKPDAAASAAATVSNSVEANAEFTSGLQSWRDASVAIARVHFDKALELDPGFAPARLYLLLLDPWTSAYFRDNYREAQNQRARLTPPLYALLDGLAPLAAIPPDLNESRRRLERGLEDFPADQLLRYALAINTMKTGRADEANAALRALVDSDPGFVLPWVAIAYVESEQGNTDAAVAALDACLRASPLATSCMTELAIFSANEGRCERAEALGRTLLANSPSKAVSLSASNLLAGTIFSQRGDAPAVMAALEQSWNDYPEADRPLREAKDKTRYFALFGDFGRAAEASIAWRSLLASRREEEAHESYAKDSMYLQLELGQNDKAARIASEFLAKRGSLVADSYFDYEIVGLRGLYLSGALSKEGFRARRETWAERERNRPPLESERGLAWVIGYARNTLDKDDALEALRVLPEYLPLPDPMTRNVESDDAIGWTYFLAGRVNDALPFLRRGAHSCRAQLYPFEQTWAHLHLGIALRSIGDSAGACASLSSVLKRWGGPERSTASAKSATLEAHRLGCNAGEPALQ